MSADVSAQTFSEAFKPFTGTPRHYVCYHTPDSVTIDGKLSEKSWEQVPWTADFVDIEGDAKPKPPLRTRVKMMWDEHYLYIAAVMQEPHIWATLKDHDAIIFQDNDFEVFIDPDGDTHQYFELEINAYNTVMDLFMSKPYRLGGNALLNWDTKGLKTAVHINGTLNQPNDKDKEWTVEMAIPFNALRFFNDVRRPSDGSTWRINFSRVEWDTDIKDNQYVKLKKPEHNWVWSPQDIINMHAPERWGYLQFSTQPTGSAAVPFQLPATEPAKQYLWQLFHEQVRYFEGHGKFAANLRELKMPSQQTAADGATYTLQLEGISNQFTAGIKGSNFNGTIYINQEGRITIDRK
ncbi:carbohydrate-binding family 9-like protein [Chitinophaga qingshengii]|uniref:Carbohydrate-binding family 9-like protein n=1 Tax=Chitinophaga qingshengii TaxID=1569794 RepID=A0ABR7TPG8_9BACT|nr:carbohydrate-binding family 9-like protein [Chitinophaga qingshengii]MBC9931468.1 carbohydrate-binding family 9-like protein [Chitinophaga qingshengii]